jgi:hypothetical protein
VSGRANGERQVGLKEEWTESSPLVVELNIVPINLVANFFVDLSIGAGSIDRREPGSNRSVSDEVLASRKVASKGLGVGDEPLLGRAISLVNGIHI